MGGGGGIAFGHASSGHVYNNVICGNRGYIYGGGLHSYNGSHPLVANCIFWDNSADTNDEISVTDAYATISYSDIEGGYAGIGNINLYPHFHDPMQSVYRLMSMDCGDSVNSPCIDAGDPNILDSLLDCSWGMGNEISDIGAYGGGDSIEVGIRGPEATKTIEFAMHENYPNPFNSTTMISYKLIMPSIVTLDICDILGRRISTLVNEYQMPGSHTAIWDSKDISSGYYFYRIRVGNVIETKMMTLIK